jgi:hypothetical protein
MTSRGNRHRRIVSCLSVGVVVLTAACQSSSGEAGDEPSDATSASTSPASPASPAPTSETTSVVEPADGVVVKVPGATMRALPTYKRVADYGIVQGYNDKQSALSLSPSLTRAKSLDAYAREWARAHGGPKRMERQDDVVVGGKYNAWHLIDQQDPTEVSHYYGVMFLDSAWLINIAIYTGDSWSLGEEEAQQVIDSLLASFKTDLD